MVIELDKKPDSAKKSTSPNILNFALQYQQIDPIGAMVGLMN